MLLKFTKMHGAGNDFVVIDLISQRARLRPRDIRKLADRHFGVGCDQVLLVEPPGSPEVDFCYRIFNADGGEVEQCGNGARCFARFVRDKKLTTKRRIAVETAAGPIVLHVRDHNQVEVNMGAPVFTPQQVPFEAPEQASFYSVELGGDELELGVLSMGNPHAVQRVADTATLDLDDIGRQLESHPRFPQRVNAGFMQVLSENEIRLRVYERGVGETLACGTGACAAVVYGILRGWLRDTVTVNLPGGKLSISWGGEDQPVLMTGPTATVFEGTIRI